MQYTVALIGLFPIGTLVFSEVLLLKVTLPLVDSLTAYCTQHSEAVEGMFQNN